MVTLVTNGISLCLKGEFVNLINNCIFIFMNKNIYVFLLGILLFLACKKDKAVEVVEIVEDTNTLTYCDTVTVSFVNQIQPIFIQNCATSGCHDAAVSGSYQFETYAQISNSSHIAAALGAIKHEASSSPMPKFQPKLNDSLIQQIECWVSQGKLNN